MLSETWRFVARFEGRHGTHHHPRLTFARGMSLMCRTACIDAYGRPGHTIFSMALHFDLNPTRELKSTILIALACSAQCTGVLACIIDAISRGSAMTMQTRDGLVSKCGPIFSVHRMINPVPRRFCAAHAHASISRTLAHTLLCFQRLTTELENHHSTAYQRPHPQGLKTSIAQCRHHEIEKKIGRAHV